MLGESVSAAQEWQRFVYSQQAHSGASRMTGDFKVTEEFLLSCDHDDPPCGPTCNAKEVRERRYARMHQDAIEMAARLHRKWYGKLYEMFEKEKP